MSYGKTGKSYVYFPHIPMLTRITTFGAIEVDRPLIYKTIKDKTVVEVDCLWALYNVFGTSLKSNRDNIYKMVSGDCNDKVFQLLLQQHYKHIGTFTDFIDKIFLTLRGEDKPNVVKAIFVPLREEIDNYTSQMKTYMKSNGGKYLMLSHDKLYYSFSHDSYTLLENMKIITQ